MYRQNGDFTIQLDTTARESATLSFLLYYGLQPG